MNREQFFIPLLIRTVLCLCHTAHMHRFVSACRWFEQNVDKSRLFSVVLIVYWRLNSFAQSCLQCERVCKQVLVANWKLGRDQTKLRSHRISRLNKTVSKFTAVLICRQYCSHCRHGQDMTVLSCPWCEQRVIRQTRRSDLSQWQFILCFFFTHTQVFHRFLHHLEFRQ